MKNNSNIKVDLIDTCKYQQSHKIKVDKKSYIPFKIFKKVMRI